jgi:thiamine pyrophosphokinase
VSFTALALNKCLPSFLDPLWERATTCVCADGGANRVHTFFGDKPFKRLDFVVADFDSLFLLVRKEFEQDFNDLHKCLKVLKGAGQ